MDIRKVTEKMRTQPFNLEGSREERAKAHRLSQAAFTLAEVLISVLIVGMGLGGIIGLYVQSAVRSDCAATSLSAQMMALSGMEQCRAAKFDPRGGTDNLWSSNFPPKVDILDVGTSAGVIAYGTNTTTVLTIATNPALKMVRVDCTWSFPQRGIFTNSLFTYRAPNQ